MNNTETFKAGQLVRIAGGFRGGPSGLVTNPRDSDGLVEVEFRVLAYEVLRLRPCELEAVRPMRDT
jgi:hypothetical protein